MTRINVNPFNFDLSSLAKQGNNIRKQLTGENTLNFVVKGGGAVALGNTVINSRRESMHKNLELRGESNKAFRKEEIGMTQHLNELAYSGASTEYIEQSLRESNRKYRGYKLSDPNTDIKVTETGGNWFGKSREIKLEISRSRKSKKGEIENTREVNYFETNLNPDIVFINQVDFDFALPYKSSIYKATQARAPFKIQQYTPVNNETNKKFSQFDESCVIEVTTTYDSPILESTGGQILAVVLLFLFLILVSRFSKWIEFQIQQFTRQKNINEILTSYNTNKISRDQAFRLLTSHRINPYEIEALLGPGLNRLNQ